MTDEFVRDWRDAFDRHGFVPSSFGCNLDMGRRRDRDMTEDEEYEFTAIQFRSAHALGFPLVRIQSAKPSLIRRLLPVAEELDLTMGWELHAPLGPNSPKVMEIRETYAEIDSPRLGLRRRLQLDHARDVADDPAQAREDGPGPGGARPAAGDLGDRRRHQRPARRVRRVPALAGDRARESLGSFARLAFNMHGHVDPAEWADIMPQIKHVHAKFYDIDEHGDEPAIDYPAIVREFVRGG